MFLIVLSLVIVAVVGIIIAVEVTTPEENMN
ncbi:hypothetical protein BCI9360_01933 [Bacillus sp. CECT 9360]|nr:hypothetical protein BCI9360_01933 [Bacillus sp. CECT 9360]